MKALETHAAATQVLADALTDKVLEGVVGGLRAVFERAGFAVGGRLVWDTCELAGGLLVRRGIKLRDLATGHVLAARVGLSVDLLSSRAGEGNLWTQVVVPRTGGKDPWVKVLRLASHHLLHTPGTESQGSPAGPFDNLLATWRGVLEGPNAWDFSAQVLPLLKAYDSAMYP